MVSTLPANYARDALLRELHRAYASLIVSFATSASTTSPAVSALGAAVGKSAAAVSASWKDIVEGSESLCGIYLSSATACRRCCTSVTTEEGRRELELAFVSLSWFYDYSSNTKRGGGDDATAEHSLRTSLLKTLSRLLANGIAQESHGKFEEDADEQLSNAMTLIQNVQSSSGEHNCALGDMLDADEDDDARGGGRERRRSSFVAALRSKFEAEDGSQPPQLQYLLAMLRASPKSNGKRPPPSGVAKTASTPRTERARNLSRSKA